MNRKFSPLSFLAAIGAGGISIVPFAFFNYTVPHPKGLVNVSDILLGQANFWQKTIFTSLETVMIVFAFLHIILMIALFSKYIPFLKSSEYLELNNNPLKNNSLLTPFIALAMSMNVLIGPIRFFVPALYENLQSLMLPAIIVWVILVGAFLSVQLHVLKSLFTQKVDLSKIGFGWLLDVFALAMLAVTGSGIAALSKNASIAHLATFISLMLATMAIFFLVIKIIPIFQKYFSDETLPEKPFLPAFLNIVPAITLLAITFFRLGHYLENNHGFHIDWFFTIVITTAFAFETWYLIFGISLLKNYFQKQHFEKEFYITQWSLICPFVAYGVLGSFVYSVFVPTPLLQIIVGISLASSVFLFAHLLYRYFYCAHTKDTRKVVCKEV